MELLALHQGLILRQQFNISKVWIEMDTLVVIQMIWEGSNGSHDVYYLLASIQRCLNQVSYRILHEDNQAASYLSNRGYLH